jgi:hypothetical protein
MPDYDADRFHPPAPLANVTLQHPTNGKKATDVRMLLDSGADATLIPQAALDPLEISADTGEIYELMAFDGTLSHAFPVRLDLVFLNKIFRGRYLVIQGDWGFLGRDILNFVPVLLDGPALTWQEFRQSK